MTDTTANNQEELNKLKAKSLAKKRITRILSSFVPSKKRIHVISYGNQWGILREGSKRRSKIFRDRKNAVLYAQGLAKKEIGSAVFIHKTDGSLEQYIQNPNITSY